MSKKVSKIDVFGGSGGGPKSAKKHEKFAKNCKKSAFFIARLVLAPENFNVAFCTKKMSKINMAKIPQKPGGAQF